MTKYAIVLDTETANSMDDPMAYDIGWAVVDLETEKIIKTESYAIAEIFTMPSFMTTAYYAQKIPQYWHEIQEGTRKLARLYTVRQALMTDCNIFGVTEIYAHNASFDYRACQKTQRYTTCSAWRWFFPYGITICDTLKMARKAFNTASYGVFCATNGYLTKRGQCKYTAEILYRYITKDNDFVEQHKGIDDVLIETQILFECRRRGVTNGALWE